MANTIPEILIDRIFAAGFRVLRQKTSFLKYITRDDDIASSKKGRTVVIPIPYDDKSEEAVDVAPSNTPPPPTDITLDSASVVMDKWQKVDFALTDKEIYELQAGTMPDQMEQRMDVLARTITRSVLSNFTGIYQYAGVAGATPFASDLSAATRARKLLNNAGASMGMRSLINNFDADENALGLNIFQRANESASTETLREGVISRAMGFTWDIDAYMPSFTGGTLSNGTSKAALINSGAVAVGDTSVAMDSTTLTGTLVVGDLFTVAGDTQQYVVTADATAAANAITVQFTPGAKVAWADNSVVTFVPDHDVAFIAMHKNAFAFASRVTDEVPVTSGHLIRQAKDPMTGLALTLEISRQYHQTVAEFSSLWGSTLARPTLAVRGLG